ncbi:unnamed protein product, partial [Allacma fusca]
ENCLEVLIDVGRFGPEVTNEDRETCSDIRFKEIGADYAFLSARYKDWLSEEMLTWQASLECCILHNYELLPIVTPSTRRKYSKLPPEGVWVHGTDMVHDGDWSWPGGDSVNARLWGHVKEPPVSLVTTQT